MIGFETCLIPLIFLSKPQSYLLYFLRFLGLCGMFYWVYFHYYDVGELSLFRSEKVHRGGIWISGYFLSNLLVFSYGVLLFCFHPKWFLTKIMNNSLEINFLKIYPFFVVLSYIVVKNLKKEIREARKGGHYF